MDSMPTNSAGKHQKPRIATFSTKQPRFRNLNTVSQKTRRFYSQTKFKIAGLIIICGLVGLAGGLAGARYYSNQHVLSTSKAAKQQYISSESQLISSIANDVGQSVVSVNVETQVTGSDFFGFPQTQSQQAAGTGIIISDDGVIMTNRHVVPAGTTTVSVTLADGTSYDGVQVIGRTADTSPLDVAFLKIPDLKGKKLAPAKLGNSSKVQIGDKVIAIGNALGQFQNTVTAGIISGFGRDVTAGDQTSTDAENLTDLFQTDAAINEGNSGGPLVNINGEVIGMNTAVAGNAQNIGFAIPLNDLKGLITSMLKGGQLQQAYLGVRYVSITADIAKQFNLKVTQGAYIASGDSSPAVLAGSPAEKAGLKDGDIIIKVNNQNIDNKTGLTAALSQYQPGDQVALIVVRDGKNIKVNATLGLAPSS